MITVIGVILLIIAVFILLHILLFAFRALGIDLPSPFDKDGYLSSYDEIHAAGEGFRDGFKTWNPKELPDCPQKYTGIDPLTGVYNEEKDEKALYYGWQVWGWFIKAAVIYFLAKYGLVQMFLGVPLP